MRFHSRLVTGRDQIFTRAGRVFDLSQNQAGCSLGAGFCRIATVSRNSGRGRRLARESGATDTASVALSLEADNEIRALRSGGLLPVLLHEFAAAS